MSEPSGAVITVLGAGYAGLTTAAELTLRGHTVRVVCTSRGSTPPITIVGTQSRRWPGLSLSTKNFSQDDLLDAELTTIGRFLSLAGNPDVTGVRCLPGLKVSRKEGVWWNPRPLDPGRKRAATQVQANMKLAANPTTVDPAVIQQLLATGYRSIDETQVLMIDSATYFDYLSGIIKRGGGAICYGARVDDMATIGGVVVNCMGNESNTTGDAKGAYSNNRGEVILFNDCPVDVPFYIIDDDNQIGVCQVPSGELYISGSPKPAEGIGWDRSSTEQNIRDANQIFRALFGSALPMLGDVSESWGLDRPTRKEGFNVGVTNTSDRRIVAQNSGHGGAGVAASWACAGIVADELAAAILAMRATPPLSRL